MCLASALKAQDSLFYPLFIAGDHRPGNMFCGSRMEIEYADLRSFEWSRLIGLSRVIERHRISLIHWNFTEMISNGYLWWLSFLHPNVKHCHTDHNSRPAGNG